MCTRGHTYICKNTNSDERLPGKHWQGFKIFPKKGTSTSHRAMIFEGFNFKLIKYGNDKYSVLGHKLTNQKKYAAQNIRGRIRKNQKIYK